MLEKLSWEWGLVVNKDKTQFISNIWGSQSSQGKIVRKEFQCSTSFVGFWRPVLLFPIDTSLGW